MVVTPVTTVQLVSSIWTGLRMNLTIVIKLGMEECILCTVNSIEGLKIVTSVPRLARGGDRLLAVGVLA